MLYDVMKYRKTITYLFFIFVKTGFTIDSKAVTATSGMYTFIVMSLNYKLGYKLLFVHCCCFYLFAAFFRDNFFNFDF